ncbi:MAG: hypothetical protein HUJ70_03130, partial [Pseudobutyrivibrio sp.]|nr:hypothetical protein [Pseudobutyrivibrio sp.]
VQNFGAAGNGVFQGICCSAPEAIAYPLVLIIDKLNGASFSDAPAATERVDCNSYTILSEDEMNLMKQTLYYTANYADSAIKGEEIVNMCASYNPDATYAGLKDRVLNLGI